MLVTQQGCAPTGKTKNKVGWGKIRRMKDWWCWIWPYIEAWLESEHRWGRWSWDVEVWELFRPSFRGHASCPFAFPKWRTGTVLHALNMNWLHPDSCILDIRSPFLRSNIVQHSLWPQSDRHTTAIHHNNMSQPQTLMEVNKRRRFAPNTFSQLEPGSNQELALLHSMCDESLSQHKIDAQLLQVGMKVRDPGEQYQPPSQRAFMPRPFFNSKRLSPSTVSALSANECNLNAIQPTSTATFCGISLAALAHISSVPIIEEQKLWSYSTASKRRQHFDDESDSDDSQEFMPRTPQLDCADAGILLPQDSFDINGGDLDECPAIESTRKVRSRKMAQPRLRRSQIQSVLEVNTFAQLSSHQQSRFIPDDLNARSCGTDMNWGETSVLQPRHDIEMDCSWKWTRWAYLEDLSGFFALNWTGQSVLVRARSIKWVRLTSSPTRQKPRDWTHFVVLGKMKSTAARCCSHLNSEFDGSGREIVVWGSMDVRLILDTLRRHIDWRMM